MRVHHARAIIVPLLRCFVQTQQPGYALSGSQINVRRAFPASERVVVASEMYVVTWVNHLREGCHARHRNITTAARRYRKVKHYCAGQ